MEVLTHLQGLVTQHAFTIGMGLLVAVILAGVAWFSMSRLRSVPKNEVLVNQARVNQADMNPEQPPKEIQEQVEEALSAQQSEGHMDQ